MESNCEEIAEPSILDKRVLKACEAVGDFIEYWGFKSAQGKVWTYLAISKEPVSQVEITRFFGFSRALVSTTMTELKKIGLVKTVDSRRNAPYVATLDIWPTISEILRSREWFLIESARVSFLALIEEIDYLENQGFETRYDLSAVKILLKLTEVFQKLLQMVISLRVPNIITSIGGLFKAAAMLLENMKNSE